MKKEYIKNIIFDQKEELVTKLKKTEVIERAGLDTCSGYIKYPNVLLITGLRRVGKSVFSNLLVKNKKYVFLNFDDERLIDFQTQDFSLVLECFYELYNDFDYILFDEIQNIRGWELFINRLREKYKIIITGSNANLLSKELATHLTGRFIDFALFPMSFKEFLTFNHISIKENDIYSTKKKSQIHLLFNNYITNSGIFEYYKLGKEFLRNLWSVVITKDIVARYNVKYPRVLEELSVLLVNSFASKISFSKLSRHFKIKSYHTINEYMRYLENSFLIFTVNKFSYKIKEQLSAFKKVYIIDQGFINALSFNFSENKGKLLENIVAVELKRRSYRENFSIYYWDNYNVECDFIIKQGLKITSTYQVCSELNLNNRKREINGLVNAMKEFNLKEGYILTESTEEEIRVNGFKIFVMPVWKWIAKDI